MLNGIKMHSFLYMNHPYSLCVLYQHEHVGGKDEDKDDSFPTLNAVLSVGEKPEENHGDDHHREVKGGDALNVERINDARYSEDEQNVEDIGAEDVANGYAAVALGCRDNAGCKLWQRCAHGDNGESDDSRVYTKRCSKA